MQVLEKIEVGQVLVPSEVREALVLLKNKEVSNEQVLKVLPAVSGG